ncbi:MAG: hypothetical protein DWQ04_06045 [Chloroflexi bacterium]|nr:MAG: hypothetical protein DWQ04_06045 [Chloroflexota bacterium]
MTTESQPESFTEFKDSFSYGSRSDLNFKFLKGLSDEDAGQFFQALLWKLGHAFVSNDYTQVLEHVKNGQLQVYNQGGGRYTYDDAPFAALKKPVADSRVMMLTSTGHFVDGDDPNPLGIENMTQQQAMEMISQFLRTPPTLSEIPTDTPDDKLRVRHGGFDIRAVQEDQGVAFPMAHLNEFANEGIIGELASPVYSFVGATAQMPLLKKTGPAWVEMFRERGVETAVLVPV